MNFKDFFKNPAIAAIVLTLLFIAAFGVGPYSSIASMLITAVGLTVMLVWVNVLSVQGISAKLKKNKEQINTLLQDLNHDEDLILNLKKRATNHQENNSPDKVKEFYTDVTKWLTNNGIAEKGHIQKRLDLIAKQNEKLQKVHATFATIGTLTLLGGTALQITNNAIASNNPANPDCPCLLDDDTIERNRIGSGLLAGGFTIGATQLLI